MEKRLDIELVNQGFVDSRTKAQELIKCGYVLCNGTVIRKNSFQVTDLDKIEVTENNSLKYVSRGGLKLEKAIEEFGINFHDKNIMDIGSSTGGFTDCAIQHGANKVVAIDVGTNVMDKELRNNERVSLYENTNVKDLDKSLFENIDYILIDVSFISLIKVFKKIEDTNIKVDVISLIKPQFECGKEIADRYKGVILNPDIHKEIVRELIKEINSLNFYIKNLTFSPIRGGSGNIEYLAYFTNKINYNDKIDIDRIVTEAFILLRTRISNRRVSKKAQ